MKKRQSILFLFLLIHLFTYLLIYCLYAADDICVTSIKKRQVISNGITKELTTVVLNGCIKVKEIESIVSGGRATLKYPVYVSKTGKEYPQFKTLTKQAADEIERVVFSSGQVSKHSQQMSYKISGFFPIGGESSRKVNVSVDFNNAVRISCGVMENKRGPWISWPARKDETIGMYIKQVLILDRKLKDKIEKIVLEKYEEVKDDLSEEE